MTIKSFSFENPVGPESLERNWRQFDQNSKFGVFEPLVTDINNFGSAEGYYQLYGPIVFYWIKLTYDGTNMTPGAGPAIYNLPYGPESVSGLKAVSPKQVSMTARAGAGSAAELLNSTQDAWVASTGGIAYIILPAAWTAAVTQNIWVQGWIFRDA